MVGRLAWVVGSVFVVIMVVVAFLGAFVRAGRFGPMLEQVPIYVIMGPEVALLGAASEGLRRLGALVMPAVPGGAAEPRQMQ